MADDLSVHEQQKRIGSKGKMHCGAYAVWILRAVNRPYPRIQFIDIHCGNTLS